MHAQGYTQVREPLARLLICTRRVTLRCAGRWPAFLMCTRRVTRRCAGRWPAFRCARAGLHAGARASSPPFDLRAQDCAQVRGPLARLFNVHAQGYTQVRGPLARLSLCTCRVTRRCAGLWPAFRSTRSGLRSGARAAGPPFVVHVQGYTQVREPLARLLLCTRRVTLRCASLWLACCCARAGLHSGARAAGPPVDMHAQGYTQVRWPLARPLIYARRCAGL
jgi:hypothetical protein